MQVTTQLCVRMMLCGCCAGGKAVVRVAVQQGLSMGLGGRMQADVQG